MEVSLDLTEKTVVESLMADDMVALPAEEKLNIFCEKENMLAKNEVCFYKVKQVSFDEEYPHREAFENIFQSIENEAFNFVYLLDGDVQGVNLYIGVVRNQNEIVSAAGKMLNATDYGKIISSAFDGNFNGSILEKVQGSDLDELMTTSMKQYRSSGAIIGIPSANDEKSSDSKYGFQGMDRLINSMMGTKWRMVIVCEPVRKAEIVDIKNDIYKIYDEVAKYSKTSFQQSMSSGKSTTKSSNTSEAKGVNYSKNQSTSDSKGSSSGGSSSSKNSSHQTTSGDSYGESTTKTTGSGESYGTNFGKSSALTVEIINKKAQEIMKYIDEELLERVKLGFSKGLFKTSIFYMGEQPADASRLKASIMSIFQGNRSSYSPLRAIDFDTNGNLLARYQNCYFSDWNSSKSLMTLHGQPHIGNASGLCTYLTAKEISLVAGLPQKEIPGITVKEGVDFGLNFTGNGDISLGSLMKHGRILDQIPLAISREVLNKHVFIAGVTGSGKTTTCHRLLMEAKCPFLVIEPAKTEYRALLGSEDFKHVVVFTVGDEMTAPFRLNPFELVAGESISSHADMLKATFTSSFPMEASMPQILEEAIYKAYEDRGWDIDTGQNRKMRDQVGYSEGDEYRPGSGAFPILSDFLKALEVIVDSKGFSERLRDDYRGSLVSRFSNLTKGSKGALFNCHSSIDFERLVRGHVIIEMENLKSAEDKSLLMGFILTRLSAVIKKRHEKDKDFRHITLVEEAHRLLSRPEYGDSGSKRAAVETFTDLLAEIRKYGESLVIVDQIPNKLAPEVLKNTNTKIIHKLFARDDKEAVGDTMLMNDKQKEFLSALEPGQAIVFTEGMPLPVQVKINRVTDTNSEAISNERVHERFMESYGDIFLQAEIVKRLYREVHDFIKNLSKEIIATENHSVSEKSKSMLHAIKKDMETYCKERNGTKFVDEELNVSDLCGRIADELRKRGFMDEIFKKRAEKFLTAIFSNGELGGEVLFSRDSMRFLDDMQVFG